jgi:hypothetical protein
MCEADYGGRVDKERGRARSEKPRTARAALKKSSKSTGGHNTGGHNAGGHNYSNIDPLLLTEHQRAPEDEFTPELSVKRITTVEMQVLINHGYPAVPPVNGPNDGLPEYEVPATAFQILHAAAGEGQAAESNQSVPETLPRRRGRPRNNQAAIGGSSRQKRTVVTEEAIAPKKRKATLNADAHARREAEALINGSKRLRSGRGTRH